jgi:mannose-6-phosphate isomerase-like protein (cupin superfamily)
MRKLGEQERTVVNIRQAAFKPFVSEGRPLAGQSFLQLDGSFPEGAGFHIYRMEPGATTQPHEHTCDEQFLVLEGELIDHDGYVYRPGDFVLLKAGSRHSSAAPSGATLAVFVRTVEINL